MALQAYQRIEKSLLGAYNKDVHFQVKMKRNKGLPTYF